MYLSIQWLGGSDWELWVFIFPVESEAKELPRLFQPHTIYIYIYSNNSNDKVNTNSNNRTNHQSDIANNTKW